jgi:hypothetical protein
MRLGDSESDRPAPGTGTEPVAPAAAAVTVTVTDSDCHRPSVAAATRPGSRDARVRRPSVSSSLGRTPSRTLLGYRRDRDTP